MAASANILLLFLSGAFMARLPADPDHHWPRSSRYIFKSLGPCKRAKIVPPVASKCKLCSESRS